MLETDNRKCLLHLKQLSISKLYFYNVLSVLCTCCPLGNSSKSMTSFLLSQPTGCNRETFYILGQAGSLTQTAVARSCSGEARGRTQNEAVDLSPGLKEPDGKSMDRIWLLYALSSCQICPGLAAR